MRFVAKVTQSGMARVLASALVLAAVVTSTGLSLADWGPNRKDVTIRVFNGDPMQNVLVPGASIRVIADDNDNPDNGVQGTTGGDGTYFFRLFEGSYTIEIRHPDFYARDFHVNILSTFQADLSIVPLESVPGPTPQPPPGGGCLPTPPRGMPLLNYWPISLNGENCTDLPLVMARNVTRNTNYVSNGNNVQTNTNDVIRIHLYVHNGTVDFPDNVARNVRVRGNVANSNGRATITAEAWADNANTITSAQKGGSVLIDMNSNESLQIIPGSAKVYGRGGNLIGPASDSVLTSGYNLGEMRGCFDFLKIVTVDAKVTGPVVTPPPPPPPPSQPQTGTVTLIKQVINNNGGTAQPNDFILSINGQNIHSGQSVTLNAGTYTASEQNRTGYTQVGWTGSCSSSGQVTIAAGENKTCTVTNDDIAPAPTPGTVSIEKTVRNVSDNQNSFVDSTTADAGETVEFQIRVAVNNTVNNLVVSDTLPNRLSYVNNSLTLDNNSAGNNLSSVNIGTATNATRIVKFRATVAAESQFPSGTTTLTNVATVSSSAGNASDHAFVNVTRTIVPVGDINLEKTVRNVSDNQGSFVNQTNADPGEVVEFQIKAIVTNTVHNITVSDLLPNRLSYVSNSLTVDNSAAGNDLNSIVVGTATSTTKTIKFRATVAAASQFSNGNTELVNTASLNSSVGSRTDTAKVIVFKNTPPNPPPPPVVPPPPPPPTATINIDKQVRNVSDNQSAFSNSTNADPGEQVEFQLRITANHTVNNISVSDSLPSRLIYVDNSLRIDGAGAGNNLGSVNVGSITSGTKNITFRANVADASQFSNGNTTLTNTASLSSSAGSDSDSADVIVFKNVVVNQTTTLSIQKTVRNSSVNANGTFVESVEARKDEAVEFKIVVTNTGSLTATNVKLQDVLPNNPTLTYLSGSLRIDGSASSTEIFNSYGSIGDLNAGQSRTITFKATVPTVTANQTGTNVATAFASNANSVSDNAQVVFVPVQAGNVSLVYSKKAYNDTQKRDATTGPAKSDDLITYTLTVQNNGTLDATSFVIEDNVLDIFQLSDPTNLNGGTYNFGSQTLSWPAVTVPANGGKVERTFTVRVKNPIPSGTDLTMTNVYGNEVKVKIQTTTPPFVAPPTGAASTLSFALALFTVSGFYLYRRHKAGKQLIGWVR